jgi:TP901 family phage tail tape measure protein
MAATTVDVILRLLGSRKFQAEAKASSAALSGIDKSAAASSARLTAAGTKMAAVGSAMTRNVTAPMAIAGGVAIKFAVDFDKSMRNVNSIAQLPEPAFQRLQKDVLALAGPTAQAPDTLAQGLYDLVSSGFNARQSLQVLRASATAATAGLTDTATSTKAVAAVLNAYRLPASKAGHVSDVLFKTVERGVISFEELASTIGETLPFASGLGVTVEEVGASIATMTKQGLSGAEASTRLRNVLITLTKGSEGLEDAYGKLGVASGEELIRERGLQGALEAVVKTTDGSKKAVSKLFPEIRAMGGALSLTGKNADEARADLAGMRDAGGATERALRQQSKSIAFQWQRMLAQMKAVAIQVGAALGPPVFSVLRVLFQVVLALAQAFGRLPGPVKQFVVGLVLFAAAAGPALVIIGKIITLCATLMRIWAAMKAALIVLRIQFVLTWLAALGPIGLVIAAVLALAAVFVLLYLKVGWFRRAVQAVWGWIKSHWKLLAAILLGPIAVAALLIVQNFGKIKAAAAAVINWLKGAWGSVKGAAISAANAIRSVWVSAFNAVKSVVQSVVNLIREAIDLAGSVADKVGDLKGGGIPFVPGLQAGGTVGRAGPRVVGEAGPELLSLPAGATVTPLPRGPLTTMAGGGDGHWQPVQLIVDGRVLAETTARAVRAKQARR